MARITQHKESSSRKVPGLCEVRGKMRLSLVILARRGVAVDEVAQSLRPLVQVGADHHHT